MVKGAGHGVGSSLWYRVRDHIRVREAAQDKRAVPFEGSSSVWGTAQCGEQLRVEKQPFTKFTIFKR